jgi:hypothetical protein
MESFPELKVGTRIVIKTIGTITAVHNAHGLSYEVQLDTHLDGGHRDYYAEARQVSIDGVHEIVGLGRPKKPSVGCFCDECEALRNGPA